MDLSEKTRADGGGQARAVKVAGEVN